MLMSAVCTNEVVTIYITDGIENTDTDKVKCFHITVQFSECSLALCQAAS